MRCLASRSMMMMKIAIFLLFISIAQGQDGSAEEYCSDFIYSSYSSPCHAECKYCFGPDIDECYECANLTELCMNTTVGAEINNTLTERCSESQESSSNLLYVYVGAGVGGGMALLLFCLFFICCCCCCCCTRRRAKRKKYTPSGGIEPMLDESGPNSPAHYESKVQSIESLGNVGDSEFIMQINNALLKDSEQPPSSIEMSRLSDPTLHESFRKSLSSGNICETNVDKRDGMTDKGYVKMESAGTVRPSKSLSDLTQCCDDEIYSEPDQTSASHLIVPSSAKKDKPATLPKPHSLSPGGKDLQKQQPQGNGSGSVAGGTGGRVSPADDEQDNEYDYESPELFKKDMLQQHSEIYYNKEAMAISLQRKGPGPPTTLYANVDSPLKQPAVPDSYESVNNYLMPKHSDTEEETDPSIYYNYNGVDRTEITPKSLEEDNMYIYMKSGQVIADQILEETEDSEEKENYVNVTHDGGHGTELQNGNEEEDLYSELT